MKIADGQQRRGAPFLISSYFPILAVTFTLLSAGSLGLLLPALITRVFSAANALTVGGVLGVFTPASLWAFVIGLLLLILIIALRLDEVAATVVLAVHLYLDWYLALRIVALLMVLALLLVYFLGRSPRFPWIKPPAIWVWGLFLVLALPPAIQGSLSLFDMLYYYPNDVFGAFIMFWMGTLLARDEASIRRFFTCLTILGVLLALHTIIQATTGIALLASSHYSALYEHSSYYQYEFAGSKVYRLGSFFIDPNWNGTFFSMTLFLPLGLFVESPTLLKKLLYLGAALIMLIAMLFTYSAGAAVTALVSIFVFSIFVGRASYRFQIPSFILIVGLLVTLWLPSMVNQLLAHGSNPEESALRIAGWQTALQVIQAFPFTGVGLGSQTYVTRAEPYRVATQYYPLEHPHNSYLEWGAMAGLPVLLVFLALLSIGLWLGIRTWRLADAQKRAALGGALTAIIALSINSISINGWTLPALGATGWMILGAIASPLLLHSVIARSQMEQKRTIAYNNMFIEDEDKFYAPTAE